MNEIRLLTLNLKNFKESRPFSLEVHGENIEVLGDNSWISLDGNRGIRVKETVQLNLNLLV